MLCPEGGANHNMPTKPREKDDSRVRALVPTRVRLLVQTRMPQTGGKETSYGQLPGHVLLVEVRNLREFRRFWRAVEELALKGAWREGPRAAATDLELPAAAVPVAGD